MNDKARNRKWQAINGLMAGMVLLSATMAAQAQSTLSESGGVEAAAQTASKLDTGDTAWVLCASALVLLMTPGLAFFYGGLVRSKNVLNTLLMSFGAMALMGVLWPLLGYTLAFGEGGNAFIGGLGNAFLNGVGLETGKAPTIPDQLYMIFQGMFFIITPALISGSLVERMKFSTFMVFMGLWGLLVYAPVAHWVWGGGWLGPDGLNVLDFAGGAVVHVNAGFAALAAALVLGPRQGYGQSSLRPHNLPFCLLGVGLLWFGWFGFNGGSALAANGTAVIAFVNTNLAAAAAMLAWMLIDYISRREMTALGAGTGAVAGLVGITPACAFVSPLGAMLVGAITAGVCYFMATIRAKGPVDDSLDAFAVHGVGGFTGAILTGIFAVPALTSGAGGLLSGNLSQFINQIIGTVATAAFTFVMAYAILLALKAVMGLRVDGETENRGLDLTTHGEEAYAESAAY